jgi:hypothetical protein
MDEMTNFHEHISYWCKYEIICQNMQEKIFDIIVCGSKRNNRPSGTRPWAVTRQGSLPPNGRVPWGRILRSEPQHMTDIIIVSPLKSKWPHIGIIGF